MPENSSICPSIIQKHWIPDSDRVKIERKTRKLKAGHNMCTALYDSREIELEAAKTCPK